jgi:hypothetical protein
VSEPSRYHYMGEWWVPERELSALAAELVRTKQWIQDNERHFAHIAVESRIRELEADLAGCRRALKCANDYAAQRDPINSRAVFAVPFTASEMAALQAETSVEHAPTCPVSRPGFVLIEGLQQCNCDFGRRLAKKLGMPFTEKTEAKP